MYKTCTRTSIFRTVLKKNKSLPFSSMPGTEKGVSGCTPFSKATAFKRILGIDPGLASTGWAVVDYAESRYRCAGWGVIETVKDKKRGERLLLIYDALQSILDTYSPDEAGMETLYFAKNVTSALFVAEARGAVTLCLTRNDVPLFEYSPNCIKKSVSGTAKADKSLVQQYVKLLLGLSEIPQPDHAADALAAAITHIHSAL